MALGDPDLRGDQIESGHRLRHRVLDLDPCVQLEEEELAPGDDELGGAGAAVVDCIGEPERRLAELEPERRIDDRRRRLLEHLLVPALDRAFPLRKGNPVTVAVPKELHLDVTRRLDVALEEDRVVAECRLGLAPRRLERASSSPAERTTRIPRPPPPAAALISSGSPSVSASPVSTTGTPASCAIRFAASLSPPDRRASGGGPTQTSPAASTASASSALSDRNPYPGCTASAPVSSAARTCSAGSR